MSQPALNRTEKTASIRPIGRSVVRVEDMMVDDQIAALRDNDDGLAAQIAMARRESQETARETMSRLCAVEEIANEALLTANTTSHYVGELKRSSKEHGKTLQEHTRGLVDHAIHLENHAGQLKDYGEQLDALRIDLDTMSAVDQADYDRLRALEKRLEHQSARRSHTRAQRRPANHALWVFYCATAVVVGGFLSFLIENHHIIF